MGETVDRMFMAFKQLVPYLRGSLWWGENDLIKERTPTFNQADGRQGHPLLSVRKEPLKCRTDFIPMLVGTSGLKMRQWRKDRCIEVTGMTHRDPSHRTYFGSIVEPSLFDVAYMIDGVTAKCGEYTVVRDKKTGKRGSESGHPCHGKWTDYHRMIPNRDKPTVNESEMDNVEEYCRKHQL